MHMTIEDEKNKAERRSVLMNTQELSEEAMFLAELRQLAGMDGQEAQKAQPAPEATRVIPNVPKAAPAKPQARRPVPREQPAQQERPARERRAVQTEAKPRAKGAWKGYLMVGLSSIVLFATIAGVIIGVHTPF